MNESRDESVGPASEPGPSTHPSVPAPPPFRRLDPRSVELERVVGWIRAVVLAGLSLVGFGMAALSASGSGVVVVVVAWLVFNGFMVWRAHAWPPLAYDRTRYRLDPDQLEIRRGVWWRSCVTVPRSRIQHTDVTQGPLERRFGLATLVVHTAGTEHHSIYLNGLDVRAATAIRDHLLDPGSTDEL